MEGEDGMVQLKLPISKFIERSFAVGAALWLSACAATVPTLEFRRNVYRIETIAIVTPAVPEKPMLVSGAGVTPLVFFGAIGGFLDMKVQDHFASEYLAELNSKGFSIGSLLSRDVAASLKTNGYTVVEAPVVRGEDEFLHNYPQSVNRADYAYLDLVVTDYGYLAGAITAPYHPILSLKFRLVRSSDGATLTQGSFVYSAFGSGVPPDSAYDFSNHGEILSDLDRSMKGLSAGTTLASAAVANALK